MPKKEPAALEPRQERFCQEYVKDLNGTQAAIRAGYSPKTANEQSSQLLARLNISARVKELQAVVAEQAQVDAVQILRELSRLGYTDLRGLYKEDGTIKDPKDWSDEIAHAVAGVEVTELFEGSGADRTWIGYTKKVKFWDKTKALELLGKHKKLFTDKVEHSGKLTLEDLLDESRKEEKS